jgi:hypothetical protein
MASKTFKIGEYARGGIITAQTKRDGVLLQCKDWNTKEVLFELETDDRREAIFELCDWTSSYYADEVIQFVEKHIHWRNNEWRSA